MKTSHLSVKLLALLAISSTACIQVRADDGIAGQAFQAQDDMKAKPHSPRVAVSRTETTGIKAPEGTLIHPQVQDAGVTTPTTRVSVRGQAEDYHIQQMY